MGNELQRLEALRSYAILDTPPEEQFDKVVKLAAELFDVPIAAMSLIDSDRQWFKAKVGLDVCQTPRDWAFCSRAIEFAEHSIFVVEDAARDGRFLSNPLVTEEPGIRFYAGAVLTDHAGRNLGTLCVIDTKPRPRPAKADLDRLSMLAQIVVDQMEIRRAARTNAKNVATFELAERMAGIGRWRYEIGSGHVTWSDEVYRIHGVARENFNPSTSDTLAFYDAEAREEIAERITHAIRTGEGYAFELKLTNGEGQVRDVCCRATCEKDSGGKVTAIFGVLQDVTDYRGAQKAAEYANSALRYFVESVDDFAIYFMDTAGTVQTWNKGAEKTKGYAANEVLGKNYACFFTDAERAEGLPQQHLRVAEREGHFRGQGWRVRRDGTTFWADVTISAIRGARGDLLGFGDVTHDLTERRMKADLLQRAKEDAERLADAQSEFLANMSHEIRTPLTSVIGFSDLLDEHGELNEQARKFVGRIRDAGQSLLAVINDILDYSKLESGQLALSPQEADVAEVATGVLQLMQVQAAAKHLRLELDCSGLDGSGKARVDPARLRQILINLVGNAIKFTDQGGVAVRIGWAKYGPSDRLRCEVCDSGPGIALEQQGQLFLRFSQLEGYTKKRHGGAGLGLAICKGLIEAMGGKIGVDSAPQKGSTFWFEIPAASASCVAPAKAEHRLQADGQHGRALIVDGDEADRCFACFSLIAAGMSVVEATDIAQAAICAGKERFDLILVTTAVSGADGAGAVEAIRSAGPNRETPIMSIADGADQTSHQTRIRQGYNGVLATPLDVEALRRAMTGDCVVETTGEACHAA